MTNPTVPYVAFSLLPVPEVERTVFVIPSLGRIVVVGEERDEVRQVGADEVQDMMDREPGTEFVFIEQAKDGKFHIEE